MFFIVTYRKDLYNCKENNLPVLHHRTDVNCMHWNVTSKFSLNVVNFLPALLCRSVVAEEQLLRGGRCASCEQLLPSLNKCFYVNVSAHCGNQVAEVFELVVLQRPRRRHTWEFNVETETRKNTMF